MGICMHSVRISMLYVSVFICTYVCRVNIYVCFDVSVCVFSASFFFRTSGNQDLGCYSIDNLPITHVAVIQTKLKNNFFNDAL